MVYDKSQLLTPAAYKKVRFGIIHKFYRFNISSRQGGRFRSSAIHHKLFRGTIA